MPDTIEEIATNAAAAMFAQQQLHKSFSSPHSKTLALTESDDESDDPDEDPSSSEYCSSEDYTSSSSYLSSSDEANYLFLLPKPAQPKVATMDQSSTMRKSTSLPSLDPEMSTMQVAQLLDQARFCDSKNQTKTMRRGSFSSNRSSVSEPASLPGPGATTFSHIQGEAKTILEGPKVDFGQDPSVLYNAILVSAGYTPRAIPCDEVNDFFLGITSDRLNCYSKDIIGAIKGSDMNFLRMAHFDLNRNMNCCNRFGESVLHTACRHGKVDVVRFLINEAKVDIRVRDDYGRTPAHDACWQAEPNMELIEMVVTEWPDLLLIADKRGFTPLHYVRKAQWPAWAQLFEKNHESVLPKRLLKPSTLG